MKIYPAGSTAELEAKLFSSLTGGMYMRMMMNAWAKKELRSSSFFKTFSSPRRCFSLSIEEIVGVFPGLWDVIFPTTSCASQWNRQQTTKTPGLISARTSRRLPTSLHSVKTPRTNRQNLAPCTVGCKKLGLPNPPEIGGSFDLTRRDHVELGACGVRPRLLIVSSGWSCEASTNGGDLVSQPEALTKTRENFHPQKGGLVVS